MLTGSYTGTIESKGRVTIPTKLRYDLGERIWIVKGIDACLYIFTQGSWSDFMNDYVTNRTLKDAKARKLQRFILGSSRELEIDRQGRINLPQDQIDYAAIEKDVVFVGCLDRIELWSAEAFEKEMAPGNLRPDELMRDAEEAEGEWPG
jgi:MraZ protein